MRVAGVTCGALDVRFLHVARVMTWDFSNVPEMAPGGRTDWHRRQADGRLGGDLSQ
jgi:hypothetical protein